MTQEKLGKINIIISMVIYGTLGVFVKYIPLASSAVSMMRGIIGSVFLVLFCLITKKKLSMSAIKQNIIYLLLSGSILGFNWMLLFEAYKYTSVSTATLCYYLAPVFVILVSPFLFKENLTAKKIVCTIVAFGGMVFVSGILNEKITTQQILGIIMGIGAAVLYATIVCLNKKMKDISGYERTLVQLIVSAIALLPYVLTTGGLTNFPTKPIPLILLAVIGIIHTGLAYVLYFGSIEKVKAQSAALLSYIDPVLALILSFTVLKEDPSLLGIIGAVMVLGSTFVSEWEFKRKKH